MRRVVTLQHAYQRMHDGDSAIEAERFEDALNECGAARELAPQVVEMRCWTAVTLASVGRHEEAMPVFREAFEQEPFWRDLLPMLVRSELMPGETANRVPAETARPVPFHD